LAQTHIGGDEIERARVEFLRDRVAKPSLIEREYADAKKRYRAIERAQAAWDRKAGLSEKRKQFEKNKPELRTADRALGKVKLSGMADALALLDFLHDRATELEELSETWEIDAFLNATDFFKRWVVAEQS